MRQPDDLLEALDAARRSVGTLRSVWCAPAMAFETRITQRRGLILGGAWAPQFILGEVTEPWNVPYTRMFSLPYIFWSPSIQGGMREWLPAAEALAKWSNSLLLVTDSIGDELLRMLITNSVRNSFRSCVVKRRGNPPESYSEFVGRSSAPPDDILKFPRAQEAWIRRRSTVLFFDNGVNAGDLEEIAIIEVGGEDLADQQERLRFLADKLRREDE